MPNQPNPLYDNQYVPGTQDQKSESKPLVEALRVMIDQWVRANVHVWLPAKILKIYDNSFVDVQILIQEIFLIQGAISIPPLLHIPVEHPRGADYWIKLPIAVGDTGRVSFCDRSLDNWLIAGGGPLNPQDARMHDYSDAVFTPGLYPQSNVLPGAADDMILHNGQAEIYIQKSGTFKITNGVNELISNLVELVSTLSTASTVAGGPFTFDVVEELVEISENLQSLEGE